MADNKHLVMNFSLPSSLCTGLKAQSEIENRPMSRIVSRLVSEYLAGQAEGTANTEVHA